MTAPKLEPYLVFNGNCAEALRFYEATIGGKIEMMMKVSESPMAEQCAPGTGDQIMHSRMTIGGQALMACDVMGRPYEGIKGCSLSLYYASPEEAHRMFEALGAGGTVTMPIQDTFWSPAFGMLTDRFGVPWMVNGGEKSFN